MSRDEQGYNGWANRATWAYVLWMDNEQGSYASMVEMAEEYLTEDVEPETAHIGLAARYEQEARQILDPEEYIENFGDVKLSEWLNGPGKIVKDVGDIDEIDWREVAEHYLSTARENRKS